MKFSQALAEIVSEFSGINHTPDFKAVRSMSTRPGSRSSSRSASGSSTPVRKHSVERRYSTLITVGVDEIPTVSITPPNGSTTPEPKYVKHQSPCNSSVVCSTSLKAKLEKFRRTNSSASEMGSSDEEEDFHCSSRKSSVSSYRLI